MSIRGGVTLWGGGVSSVFFAACLLSWGQCLIFAAHSPPLLGWRVIRLSRGVMVAQQVLVLFVKVRILARQQASW